MAMKLAHPKVRWSIGIALFALAALVPSMLRRERNAETLRGPEKVTIGEGRGPSTEPTVESNNGRPTIPNHDPVLRGSTTKVTLGELPPNVRNTAHELIEVSRQSVKKVDGTYQFG